MSVNRLGEDGAKECVFDCVCVHVFVLFCFLVHLQSPRACVAVISLGILFLAGDCGWVSVCLFTFFFFPVEASAAERSFQSFRAAGSHVENLEQLLSVSMFPSCSVLLLLAGGLAGCLLKAAALLFLKGLQVCCNSWSFIHQTAAVTV